MESNSFTPATSHGHGTPVFTLEALETTTQVKSVTPRIKVDKTFELTNKEGVKWFVDSYDTNANFKEVLHLFLSQGDTTYGDMGIVVGAKDDVDARATPCFTCNVLPDGETTKANKFCLSLDSFHPAHMTGSKLGKENSIVKLGLKITDFSNQENSGVDNVEDLVKAVKHAKRALDSRKKPVPEKQTTTAHIKKMVEKKGRALVKSALEASRDACGTSSKNKKESEKTKSPKLLDVSTIPAQDMGGSSVQEQQQAPTKKRKAPAKHDLASSKRQRTRAVGGSMDVDVFDDEVMEVERPNEEGSKALISLEKKKGYYPFGLNEVFMIDVMKCYPAPSNYVYRRLNKDWVRILTQDFIEDPKQEEILAILMPCDRAAKQPLHKLAKEDIHKVEYWIISGQHSISAAKGLQTLNIAKVTLQLRQQFRFRRSTIILNCPPKISRDISKDANISVAKSMQKEPFLDQLLQARAQWRANGHPKKPLPGVNQPKMDESWKVIFVSLLYLGRYKSISLSVALR